MYKPLTSQLSGRSKWWNWGVGHLWFNQQHLRSPSVPFPSATGVAFLVWITQGCVCGCFVRGFGITECTVLVVFAVITQLCLLERLWKAITLFVFSEHEALVALGGGRSRPAIVKVDPFPATAPSMHAGQGVAAGFPSCNMHQQWLVPLCLSCSSHCFLFISFWQIFYRVVADIEPGEELLLFMKSEDYSHEAMAPDIHG